MALVHSSVQSDKCHGEGKNPRTQTSSNMAMPRASGEMVVGVPVVTASVVTETATAIPARDDESALSAMAALLEVGVRVSAVQCGIPKFIWK